MAQSNGSDSISKRFRGLIAPIPTVFDGTGEVDIPVMRELTNWYMDKGARGFFVLGSQGQGPACRSDQRKDVAETVLGEVNGSVPVVIQVGAVDPYTSMDLATHAAKAGADAIGMVGPYYYSDRNEWEIIEQHKQVAAVAPETPMFLYNNPEYSGYPTTAERMQTLRNEIPLVFGAKLAAGTIDQAKEYIDVLGEEFNIFIPVNQLVEGMKIGVSGSIAAGPPVTMPEVGVALVDAIQSGDEARATEIQNSMNEHGKRTKELRQYGRAGTMVGLQIRGFAVKQYPRWKTKEMTAEHRALLESSMKQVLDGIAVPA
jgi:dihydrodipicolinate synthase/N-acetylneuraminate lyase